MNGEDKVIKLNASMTKEQANDYLDAIKDIKQLKYLDLGEYLFYDDKIDLKHDNKSKNAKVRKDGVMEFEFDEDEKPVRMLVYAKSQKKKKYKMNMGLVTYKKQKMEENKDE